MGTETIENQPALAQLQAYIDLQKLKQAEDAKPGDRASTPDALKIESKPELKLAPLTDGMVKGSPSVSSELGGAPTAPQSDPVRAVMGDDKPQSGMDYVDPPKQALDMSQVRENGPELPTAGSAGSQPDALARNLMGISSPADPPSPGAVAQDAKASGIDPMVVKWLRDRAETRVGESTPLPMAGSDVQRPNYPSAADPTENSKLKGLLSKIDLSKVDLPMAAAQMQAGQDRVSAALGAQMNQALNRIVGHPADEGDEAFKRGSERANDGIKDVQTKHLGERQAEEEKAAEAETQAKADDRDLASSSSQQRGLLALKSGWITLDEYKASKGGLTPGMYTEVKDRHKDRNDQKRTALQDRKEADASAEDTRYHKDVIALGYAKLNADRKREKAEKAPSDIPIKEQHAVEAEGKVPAAVGKLEAARQQIPWYQAAIKASHLGSYGEQAAYDRILTDEAPNALGASAADARITPAMINQFTGNAPGYFANAEQASAHWNTLKENAAKARDENLAVLKAGNHNPAQIQELEARSAPSAAQSAGRSVIGYSYNKDRSKQIPVYSDGTKGQPEPSNG